MSRKVIAITVGVAVVGIGVGVIIGYFSHPETPAPAWVNKVESYFKDVDENIISSFIEQVQANNIKSNLRYLAEKPHMATSPRDEELARFIRDQWMSELDEAYLTPYDVMHGFLSTDPNKPNKVTIIDPSNNEIAISLRMTEIVYDEYMKDPESIVPYYSAYGPPGDVQGKLVYANYGSDEDYAELISLGVDLNGTIVLVKYGGGVGRGGKASVASKYLVKGVLVFSDPNDYVVTGEKGYPDDSSLPGTGVQRGSTLQEYGDPTTPYYPSTPDAYRIPLENITQLPPIPLQPIGYEDAGFLLSNLDGPKSPSSWSTGLDVTEIRVGPGFSAANETREVHLVANNIYNTTTTYNVIGIIRGREEPDRYVMYGNHRDSWVYGAVDPSSGTACMLEITRTFSELLKSGWRPRRTIIFGSWGSEEFGLLGSTEWVEDNVDLLARRGISYINVDIAVFANMSFFARASPLLSEVLYDAASKVKDPTDPSITVKDTWMKNFPNELGLLPLIARLFTSSDYAAFYQMLGVTSADLSYRGNPAVDDRYKISPYPTYHTAYDTFDYVERFVDPGFIAHQTVSRVAGAALILLADSLIIPFSLGFLSDFLNTQIAATTDKFESQMMAQEISLDPLVLAGYEFSISVVDFENYVSSTMNKNDIKQINAVNERLLAVEKCFIEPRGLPEQPFLRHVSGSPGNYDDASGSFPGIQDAMFNIAPEDAEKWEVVKQQVALVTYKINSAIKVLKLPTFT